jgi:hypothetical protein
MRTVLRKLRPVRQGGDVSDKQNNPEKFSVIEKSGAVSVELGRFLKSNAGGTQIDGVRQLREYNNGSREPESAERNKK